MGLISKRASRARTATAEVAAEVPLPYILHGMPFVASLVRGVALAVAQTSANLGNLWVEQDTNRRWSIFGARGTDRDDVRHVEEPAWKVQVDVLRIGGAEHARISTPFYKTRDDVLVDADQHDELRDLLRAGLTSGRLPLADIEVDLSERGLQVQPPPLGEFAVLPLSDQFQLVTTLDVGQLTNCLAAVPFGGGKIADDSWNWDLSAGETRCTVAVTLVDDGLARRLSGTVAASSGRSLITDVRAVRHAQCFLDALGRIAKKLDSSAELSGGEVVTAALSIEAP